ncbi:hypothetical protein ACFU2M_20205, partial [Bacillus velezensis]
VFCFLTSHSSMKKMIDVIYKVCEGVLKYKASLNSQPWRFYKKVNILNVFFYSNLSDFFVFSP